MEHFYHGFMLLSVAFLRATDTFLRERAGLLIGTTFSVQPR